MQTIFWKPYPTGFWKRAAWTELFLDCVGFPGGEWNGYVPASIAFWVQKAACQGHTP